MTYISLFSGIEAASVAWKQLGWTPLVFAEIDPFASAVLAHHYPDVPNLGDVEAFDWSAYHLRSDVVIGGSPCQSFSVAGLRGSLSDERGDLSLAYCRIINDIDPTWSVYENVPGILNTRDNAFGCLLAGLVGEDDALTTPAYMGSGWPHAGVVAGPARTAAWRVLDAQFFGVAQRRRRVFVLTCRGSGNWDCAEALFPVADGLSWDSPPSRKTGARTAASLTRGADSGGKGRFHAVVTHALMAVIPFDPTQITSNKNFSNPMPGDPCHPLAVQSHAPAIAFALNAPSGGGRRHEINVATPTMVVRRLTPTECLRLQAFPDDYLDITYRGNSAADTPKYRAIGNSMCVNVIRWLGQRIAAVDRTRL